jgi:ABC-type Zn uptake system ZnuABC Zn-binding protein ZnuA
VADATVVVTLGLEFEGWFDDMYAASGSTAPVIVASTPLTPLPADDHEAEAHSDEGHAEDEAGHGEYDPHVWQDVSNVSSMVAYLATELSAQFPEHASTFARNAAQYQAELTALDQEIMALSQEIPAERRLLITNHDTFGYFAARYGYTIVDSVLGSVTTEGGDPGATQIAALADSVQKLGIRTIFVENTSNTQISENLATEAGITLAPPLYTDALGNADSSGATYVAMMRYNIQTIHTALMP